MEKETSKAEKAENIQKVVDVVLAMVVEVVTRGYDAKKYKKSNENQKHVQCHVCGKWEHYAHDCPEAKWVMPVFVTQSSAFERFDVVSQFSLFFMMLLMCYFLIMGFAYVRGTLHPQRLLYHANAQSEFYWQSFDHGFSGFIDKAW